MARIGIKDRPGLSNFGNTAPSNYIIVNDISPSSVNSNISNKSFVILFDWRNFISHLIASSPQKEEAFMSAIYGVLDRMQIKDANITNFEHVLNREINNTITGFKTTVVNNLEGSSCTIDLENFDDKWIVQILGEYYKQSIIPEGIRFIIDARGRLDTKNFYRIFTGFVTATSETSNPTERRLSLSCKDYARWLARTRYNVHPAIYEIDPLAVQGAAQVFTSNLQGKSGAEIIERLISVNPKDQADKINQSSLEIWEKIELVEGETGLDTNQDGIVEDKYRFNFHHKYDPKELTTYTYDSNYKPKILIWGHTGDVYTKLFSSFSLYLSEFKTKKDIILDIASITKYVAYIDGAGNCHYHPPRFEEDYYLIMKNGENYKKDFTEDEARYTFWITDDEILASSYTQNEEEICTVARGVAQGAFGIFEQVRTNVSPQTYHATVGWEDGIRRFGFRERTFSTAALTDFSESKLAVFTAANLLRANQERIQMSATIPMRPELQVDRPIYDYSKEKYYHIRSVAHSYNAGGAISGGDWTTSIIAYAGRGADEKITSNLFAKKYPFKNVREMVADGPKKFTTLNLIDLEKFNPKTEKTSATTTVKSDVVTTTKTNKVKK